MPERLYATYKPTGKRVEILEFATDRVYITEEPGDYTKGRLVPYGDIDPPVRFAEASRQGWTPWWDRDDTVV